MIRLIFLSLMGIFIGGIVHIASLMVVPVVASKDAYARIEPFLGANRFMELDSRRASLPNIDPAFEYRFCRFDLRDGPIRITMPVGDHYFSLAFHARDGGAFYALNHRSAVAGMLEILLYSDSLPEPDVSALPPTVIPLSAPTNVGFIVAKAFVGSESRREQIQAILKLAHCDVFENSSTTNP